MHRTEAESHASAFTISQAGQPGTVHDHVPPGKRRKRLDLSNFCVVWQSVCDPALFHTMTIRQPPLMKNAGYENSAGLDPIEDNMPLVFHPAETRTNAVAGTP